MKGICDDSKMAHNIVRRDYVHLVPRSILSGQVTISAMSHVGMSAFIIQGLNVVKSTQVRVGALIVNNILAGVKAPCVPTQVREK